MHDTRKLSVTSSLWGMISISVRSIPCNIIKSSVWLKQCAGPMMFCLTPKQFIRSVNASPNASFVLSTWMLKFPTISALSTLTNRSESISANSFVKSVYGPGGLYKVARARDRRDFFCISDSVTLSISISNELNLYPVFWVTLRISLYIDPSRREEWSGYGRRSRRPEGEKLSTGAWIAFSAAAPRVLGFPEPEWRASGKIASRVHGPVQRNTWSRGGGSVSSMLHTYPGLVSISPGCFQRCFPFPRTYPHLHSKVDTNLPLKQVTVKQW